jgi:hypothetical protein
MDILLIEGDGAVAESLVDFLDLTSNHNFTRAGDRSETQDALQKAYDLIIFEPYGCLEMHAPRDEIARTIRDASTPVFISTIYSRAILRSGFGLEPKHYNAVFIKPYRFPTLEKAINRLEEQR